MTPPAATSSPSSTAAAPCRPSSAPFAASSSAATDVTVLAEDSMRRRRAGHRRDVPPVGRRHRTGPTRLPERRPLPRLGVQEPVAAVRPAARHASSSAPRPATPPTSPRPSPTHRPDLVVCSFFASGRWSPPKPRACPFDVLMPNAYLLPARGMPPFGLGLQPAPARSAGPRDRLVTALVTPPVGQGPAPRQRPARVARARPARLVLRSGPPRPAGSWC